MKRALWVLAFCAVGALQAAPDCAPKACVEKGVKAFVEEEYKQAQEWFEAAAEKDPDNAETLIWLGRAYGRRAERATGFKALGAFSLARKVRSSFERALEVDPKNVAALESLVDFYVQAPGIVGGGVDKADPLAERLFAIDQAKGRRARATIHQAREEWDQAEAALRQAVEADPDDTSNLLSLAAFLARRGWFDKSDELYAQALRREPDSPQVWYSRARELVRAGRKPDEARRLLERYLATPLYAPDAEPYSDARKLLGEL